MRKKCYHFFGGLLNAQANWLNKMSENVDYYYTHTNEVQLIQAFVIISYTSNL